MANGWTDHHGVAWREPTTAGPLLFYKVPSHTALRAFVFVRDGFACAHCRTVVVEATAGYDGRRSLRTANDSFLVVDHIVSRRNGGRHHPSNMQALCDRCNARKSSLVDSKSREAH